MSSAAEKPTLSSSVPAPQPNTITVTAGGQLAAVIANDRRVLTQESAESTPAAKMPEKPSETSLLFGGRDKISPPLPVPGNIIAAVAEPWLRALMARPSGAASPKTETLLAPLALLFLESGVPFDDTALNNALRVYKCDGILREAQALAPGRFEAVALRALKEQLKKVDPPNENGEHELTIRSVALEKWVNQQLRRDERKTEIKKVKGVTLTYKMPESTLNVLKSWCDKDEQH